MFAQLIGDVGVPETAEMAHRLGITMVPADGIQANGDPYGISLTLGAAEVSPLDMAAAYSVFANRGNQLPATPILKVTDAKGNVIEDNTKRTPKRVLSEVVADNVTDALKGVVTSGTGTGAAIGRPDGTAGKTGSADENRDAWFVGFTPALSTSVWMGYSDSNTRSLYNIKGVSRVYGGTIPAVHLEGLHGGGPRGRARRPTSPSRRPWRATSPPAPAGPRSTSPPRATRPWCRWRRR